jgi:predicted MPP superfamily phosphohydrolase
LEGLRILHLTDFHCRRYWDPAYDDLLARIAARPPDIIFYTGDFVDNRFDFRRALPIVQKWVQQLKSRLGTFAILGNHDGDLMAPALAGLDITLIDHRRLILHSGDAAIELIGVAGVDRLDLDLPFLKSLGDKPTGAVRIILSHFPDTLRKVTFLRPDLYLCGHTHGGQICLPTGLPIIRHDNLPRRFGRGIHRLFGTWLVVNRGLGFSSRAQVRLFCPAEVIEMKLVRR